MRFTSVWSFVRISVWLLPMMSFSPLSAAAVEAEPPSLLLADNGHALLQVIVGKNASKNSRNLAGDLALYLGRIAGSSFEVKTGDGASGIVVGLPGDFEALPVKTDFDPADPRRCEEYLLQSTGKALYLLGATEMAVEDAVWDILCRLGYRQFFPGRNWEIIPSLPNLSVAVNTRGKPSFLQRKMSNGSGSFNKADIMNRWLVRNRVRSGFDVREEDVFWRFYLKNKTLFEEQPQFLALQERQSGGHNFCLSNPALRRMLTEYAAGGSVDKVQKFISVSSRAGWEWCNCAGCAAIGLPSDRMVLLANETTRALPGSPYVGFTAADALLASPAKARLAGQVAVTLNIPTLLMLTDTAESQWQAAFRYYFDGWKEAGARNLGISCMVDGPSPATDLSLEAIKGALPFIYAAGINRIDLDIGERWGRNGLQNYLLSRVLWDVREGDRLDKLVDEFFALSFGSARKPMAEFFRLVGFLDDDDNDKSIIVSDKKLSRLYSLLGEALKLSDDKGVISRIGDMIIYTRLLDLQRLLDRSPKGEPAQKASGELMKFAYRTRESFMMPVREMFDNPSWYGASAGPENASKVAEGKNPWKVTDAVTGEELLRIVEDGIRAAAAAPSAPADGK